MTELRHTLERLGLSQYLNAFTTEGFDTWETLLDITESDLTTLNVKLGHRRKLQRAIAEERVHSGDRALSLVPGNAPSVDGSYRSDESATESKTSKRREYAAPDGATPVTKRKYRRHPKPDENAPERPASAYVIFSNDMREDLKGQDLSFTEIAKTVGERWQVLSPNYRDKYERQAAAAKEKYYTELADYKKTPQYALYQDYLADFKAKHAPPATEGRRSKLEPEMSFTAPSNRNDHAERVAKRLSDGFLDDFRDGRRRSGSSPAPPLRPRRPRPVSGSPKDHPVTNTNSPRLQDPQSSMPVSPVSASLRRETSFDLPLHTGSASTSDAHDRGLDRRMYSAQPSLNHSYSAPLANAPVVGQGARSPQLRDLLSRRPHRESATLPPLVHDDTTISSESIGYSPPYQGSLLPAMDAAKEHRVLPQPVPTPGYTVSPLDRKPLLPRPQAAPFSECSHGSPLAALLRAGELARDADMRD